MSNKYYIIAEYNFGCGYTWEYISRVGESSDDTWNTWTTKVLCEYKNTDNHPSPVRFETKAAAMRILAPLKAARIADWHKNNWYYTSRGYRKPNWKIYSIEE